MDVVIIADFCDNFAASDNNRFLYIVNLLKNDFDIELISSDYDHNKKKYFPDVPRVDGYKLVMLHESAYPQNVCLQRFWGHITWARNVKKYLESRKKPDIIYCAIPTLLAAKYVGEYCRKNNVHFMIDIQDLWPEAFQMVFDVPVISDICFSPFRYIANKAYNLANEIFAVSQTYVDRATSKNKHVKNATAVYIGTELDSFDNNVKQNKVVRADDEFWLGYCGSLSDSYDIPCVIDALKIINNTKVKLIVIGGGHLQEKFRKYANDSGINAEFTGFINYPQMCGLLASCNATVNPIRGKSAASIINKHADYAATGLPVINTQDSIEYCQLVDEYNMGFNCKNGDAADVACKISYLIEHPKESLQMGKNARKCAEERFDRKTTYKSIIKAFREYKINENTYN